MRDSHREVLLAEAEVFGRALFVGGTLGSLGLLVSGWLGYPGWSLRNVGLVVLAAWAGANLLYLYMKWRRPGLTSMAQMAAQDHDIQWGDDDEE